MNYTENCEVQKPGNEALNNTVTYVVKYLKQSLLCPKIVLRRIRSSKNGLSKIRKNTDDVRKGCYLIFQREQKIVKNLKNPLEKIKKGYQA